jgi:hypothetical protein
MSVTGSAQTVGSNPSFTITAQNTSAIWNAASLVGRTIQGGTPTNHDILQYNSGTALWEHVQPTWISNNQTITLSGAVTGSGATAITTTLASNIVGTTNLVNNAATYAKIQQVTAQRLLGNPTGSTANASEIPISGNLQWSGSSLVGTTPSWESVLITNPQVDINNVPGGNIFVGDGADPLFMVDYADKIYQLGGVGTAALYIDDNVSVNYLLNEQQTQISDHSAQTVNTNALLQLESTTKGFLPPRMTGSQRSAMSLGTGDAGMMVYDTNAKSWYGWDGAAWRLLN